MLQIRLNATLILNKLIAEDWKKIHHPISYTYHISYIYTIYSILYIVNIYYSKYRHIYVYKNYSKIEYVSQRIKKDSEDIKAKKQTAV